MDRLDTQKLELLRRWGDGLAVDPRDELRAAGRAIGMLIEEVDRLNIELADERRPQGTAPEDDDAAAGEPDLQSSLGARLAHLGRRRKTGVSGESV